MIKTIQRRFALSYQGAKDFLRGVLFTTLLDLALMLPAVYVFLFLDDWLKPLLVSETSPVHGLFYYGLLGIGFMGVMYVIGFSSITVLLLRSMTKVQYAECHWQRSYVYCHWLFSERRIFQTLQLPLWMTVRTWNILFTCCSTAICFSNCDLVNFNRHVFL